MAILGLDFGQLRIGLAISQGVVAAPLAVLANDAKFFAKLKRIIDAERIDQIVLGIPEKGGMAQKVIEFGQMIRQKTGLPVRFYDETFTTEEAKKYLIEAGGRTKKRRRRLDSVAAAIILNSYLESAES